MNVLTNFRALVLSTFIGGGCYGQPVEAPPTPTEPPVDTGPSYDELYRAYSRTCTIAVNVTSRQQGCGVARYTNLVVGDSHASLYAPPEMNTLRELVDGGECRVDCTWPANSWANTITTCSVRFRTSSNGYRLGTVNNLTDNTQSPHAECYTY